MTASSSAARAPTLFIGHGAPTLAIDAEKGAPLLALGQRLAKPRAIIVVSAHWTTSPVTIGTTETRPLVHDYRGFPPALHAVTYDAPGAPALAEHVEGLLEAWAPRREATRGLDHGVWTPLVHLRPQADLPVLQVSLPIALGPEKAVALGRDLAPLRDAGVLLVGSGNLTHNLRELAPEGTPPPAWAEDFDAWAWRQLEHGDVDTLVEAPARAPAFARNHPTDEHWLPLLFALGAAGSDAPETVVEGWEYGSLSRRSVMWAAR